MAKEVVISDNSLNSYGFRVLTEGIDITQFQRNPILLWMHTRPYRGTTDEVLPLGTVENLRIDGESLVGTPVFDESDEFARKVKAKWDAGILKMVSAGLKVIEESDDPAVLLQGQRYATVTKSKLIEVSIVDIGSNDNALALYNANDEIINLAQGGKGDICLTPIINPLIAIEMDIKQIALALGLPETATEQEVNAKIAQLRKDSDEVVTLRQDAETRRNEAITLLVDGAIKEGKFSADKKDHFVNLGKKVGLASLKETIDLMTPAKRPSGFIHPSNQPSGEYKKLSDVPVDKLAELRKDSPEQYKQLYMAEYGVAPDMKD
ncbi:MAG: HK97 family phage prohead protease [Paludibacteraceae bacterium]|nr:HK97 family phage prohead protease [Paludibacteraceae bacterium]